MRTIYSHLRLYIIRGLLAVIPLILTFYVLRFLYVNVDQQIVGLLDRFTGYSIPGIGFLMVFTLLYVLGLMASNIIGRSLFGVVERITTKIPLVKTFYQAGKQIAGAFSIPDTSAFKRAVYVEYLSPGQWTLGFVTGVMKDKANGETVLRVYVPTPPIPTSGVIIIIRESQTRESGMGVEEAMKVIMSVGLIGPEFVP
ncbi:DUF502 domain-containing protein [candidate division KSB1 bacterium]